MQQEGGQLRTLHLRGSRNLWRAAAAEGFFLLDRNDMEAWESARLMDINSAQLENNPLFATRVCLEPFEQQH